MWVQSIRGQRKGLTPSRKNGYVKTRGEIQRYSTSAAWSLMIRATDLVWEGNFDKCLEFIHDEFFSDMETAMARSVEALTAFEEKCK